MKELKEIPSSLRIFGWDFDVLQKNVILSTEDKFCLGQTDLTEGIIEIYDDMKLERKWVTLIHEILHVGDINEELSEEQVVYLSWFFFQVLKENGFLWKE